MSQDFGPPFLNSSDNYSQWRAEVEEWRHNTVCPPQRQALALRTKLTGQDRDLALGLDAAELNSVHGMNILLGTLDNAHAFKAPRPTNRGSKWDAPPSSHRGAPALMDQDVQPHDRRSHSPERRPGSRFDRPPDDQGYDRPQGGRFDRPPPGRQGGRFDRPPPDHGDAYGGNFEGPQGDGHGGRFERPPNNIQQGQFGGPGSGFNAPPNNGQGSRFDRPPPGEQGSRFDRPPNNGQGQFERPNDDRHNQMGPNNGQMGQQPNQGPKRKSRFDQPAEIQPTNQGPSNSGMTAEDAARATEKARQRALELTNKLIEEGKCSTAPPLGAMSQHFVQDKVFVGIFKAPPEFNLVQRLQGQNNSNLGYIATQTNAKVIVRGKGSGYLEPMSGRESFEALHMYISHPNNDGLGQARQLCQNLIDTVQSEYHQWEQQQYIQSAPASTAYPPPPQPVHYPTKPNYPVRGAEQAAGMPPNQMHYPPPGVPPAAADGSVYKYSNGAQQPPPHRIDQGRGPNYDDQQSRDSQHKDSRDSDRREHEERDGKRGERRRRSRSRSPDRRRRSRSRSRSPHRRRSRSRSRSNTPPHSKEGGREETSKQKRKFTEGPAVSKPRRKFSEDPKLIEKSKSDAAFADRIFKDSLKNPLREEESEVAIKEEEEKEYFNPSSMKKAFSKKSQFTVPPSRLESPPPPKEITPSKGKKNVKSILPPEKKTSKPSPDKFAIPTMPAVSSLKKSGSARPMSPPIGTPPRRNAKSAVKPPVKKEAVSPAPVVKQSSVLKMGALSSLSAYDDDSDSD